LGETGGGKPHYEQTNTPLQTVRREGAAGMTLLLKKLEIHGFKSFATPTVFAFDRGITAIIGPNGSGKSNVAEALRWVLGEQQYSNLRGRKTEDIIFAGSDRRAPLGMAEVVLTLDNSDGDLPLDFSEITVARRAYRSGESQYLINGSRVRLKDIQQLTAPLGQSHTIIGQGLVDAVLSQRPEDRRGLFEHAAGIAGLRLRANDAERGLGETANNAQRLHDILAELEPRVRSLERSAKQAREYGSVRDRLHELQRHYYGALWRDSSARITEARATVKAADIALAGIEEFHQRASQDLAELRTRERKLGALQAERQETLAGLERALATARHQLELLNAETRSSETRLSDLNTSRAELEERSDGQRADMERLTAESIELQSTLEMLEGEFESREQSVLSAREQRAQQEQKLAALEARVLHLSREIATTEGRLHSFQNQRDSIESERLDIQRQLEEDTRRHGDTERALEAIKARMVSTETSIKHATSSLTVRVEELAARLQAAQQSQADIDTAERGLANMRSQLEILERTYDNGDGLYAGVRALLRAVRRGRLDLPGMRGTLAELIDVPREYETAIEVALGGHVQDVIVESWSDAEIAIAHLKRENAGRATFQPLDTVRRSQPSKLDIQDEGIVGVASNLLNYSDDVTPVVEQTLGRVLIVQDLAASRRILRNSRGWTLVTLAGEITRPSGSVTGGSAARSAGLLARERERRTLPEQITRHERAINTQRHALASGRLAIDELETAIASQRHEIECLRAGDRDLAIEHDRLERALEAGTQALQRQHERSRELDHRTATCIQEQKFLQARLAEFATARDQTQVERDTLASELARRPESLDESLSELRAQIAAARERLRSLQSAANRARVDAENAETTLRQRAAEITRLRAGLEEQAERRTVVSAEITQLEASIGSERAEIQPLIENQQSIAPQIATAERDLDRSIGSVRDAERLRDRTTLDLARCQDEQVFLTERIRNDLEIDDPAALIAEAGETGEHVEKEINRLRERLRRMSAVGEDVLEEHAAESERLQFLSSQLDDVESAAESLRAVLTDLHRKMAASFSDTFAEVAAEFEQTFKRLFGGGTAKLSQQNDDDEPGGVDIVAQPPGKRLQGLNQLSGGERALTAVALLVAIQRVNPSPFCLLDEVDAALDESNVVRFKDELRDLSTSTQYVVITHNRGTIEGADTLYGVSMGDDGVSRTISLRLDEAIRAVEEQGTIAAG
jgi:chromosome segregation protein